MSYKPNRADILARIRKYTPGVVGRSARAVNALSVAEVSHGCVQNDPAAMADAVMNAGHIQFKDAPALLAAIDAVLALHVPITDDDTYRLCGHCTNTGDRWYVPEGADEWPCPTVRAITEHIDVEVLR